MLIAQHFVVGGPMRDAWPLLAEPAVVSDCFPGATLTSASDDGTYRGSLAVAFGPVTVTFEGRAQITIDEHAHTMTIAARGQDRQGRSRAAAEATVHVTPDGAEATAVEINGQITVQGALARFAETGGARLTEELLQEFSRCLAARARPSQAPGEPSQVHGAPARPQPLRPIRLALTVLWERVRRVLRRRRNHRSPR